jgi:rhodanese-related sulfurtransferase
MNTITAQQLQEMKNQQSNLLLINTLSEEHFEATKIPGAVNIPQDSADFIAQVTERADGRDTPIVVYCASAQCSSSTTAAEKLEAAGFRQVFEFVDGAEGWEEIESASAAK